MSKTLVQAPVAGRAVRLGDVPDPVFSQGMVGYGAAVDPPREVVEAVAPVSGRLLRLMPHAYVVMTPDNVGVLVNDEFYYPGDSYTVPDVEVGTLAAPIGAPWLKIGEAMDFVLAVKPKRAIYAHDMTLSAAGKKMHADRLDWATQQNGGTFTPLDVTESLDI